MSREVCTRRLLSGTRRRESKTTRTGWRPPGSSDVSRTVSRGSSASAVPMPTATASWRARSSCTLARASGPVTHFEAPLRVAMRPSSDSASFSATWGSPSVMYLVHGAISARACPRPRRRRPSRPRRRAAAAPPPATPGLGSSALITTRVIPRRGSRPRTAACARCGCRARASCRASRRARARPRPPARRPRREAPGALVKRLRDDVAVRPDHHRAHRRVGRGHGATRFVERAAHHRDVEIWVGARGHGEPEIY